MNTTMARMPGTKSSDRGAMSGVTTTASLPRRLSTWHKANDEPRASPSGDLWHVMAMRCTLLMSARNRSIVFSSMMGLIIAPYRINRRNYLFFATWQHVFHLIIVNPHYKLSLTKTG